MAISIDIEKKLRGFTLRVKFDSNTSRVGILGRFRQRKKHDAPVYCRD